MFTTSLALTAFTSLALAQSTVTVTETLTVSNIYTMYTTTALSTYTTGTSDTASTPTTSSDTTGSTATSTTTHSIQVGPSGKLIYSPSNISANVGDTVEFFFNPKNHTVTQSSFAAPCEKLEASTGTAGLDTGFANPTNVSLTTPGFSFVVNATTPIWFYCRQTGHCKQGMVFAVNANANKTFDAFLSNAENSGSSSTTPSGSSGAGSSGSATGTDTASTSTSSSSNNNGGMSTSVNLGLTAAFAVVGGFILAL